MREFNRGNGASAVVHGLFGQRVNPGKLWLVARNNVPELVEPSMRNCRLRVSPAEKMESLGMMSAAAPVIGAYGRFIVQVRPGYFGLAWLGQTPTLLGPGPHVLRHPNFSMDSVQPFVSQGEAYLRHGNIHVLRVREGKLAKLWKGTAACILEARAEPYVFNDPQVRIEMSDGEPLFVDATEPLVMHGALKRLLPRVGTVAIVNKGGSLSIEEARKDGSPIMLSNPTHSFNGFLATTAQTLVFPSDEVKRERRRERPGDTNYHQYEIMQTSDGAVIGVKLLVVYHVSDPLKALGKLQTPEKLRSHIENLVVADFGNVIQQCNSLQFQSSSQTSTRKVDVDELSDDPSAPVFYQFLQDSVKNQLRSDFESYGITLERLNVETPTVLKMTDAATRTLSTNAEVALLEFNRQIASSKASLQAESIAIKQQQEFESQLGAERTKLEVMRLKTEAAQAQAEAEAAASRIRAEADAAAARIRADAEAYATLAAAQAQAEALEKRGKMLREYPELLEIELAKIKSQALGGLSGSIVSPEVAASLWSTGAGNPLFAEPKKA